MLADESVSNSNFFRISNRFSVENKTHTRINFSIAIINCHVVVVVEVHVCVYLSLILLDSLIFLYIIVVGVDIVKNNRQTKVG
jgi:hypothetical protein